MAKKKTARQRNAQNASKNARNNNANGAVAKNGTNRIKKDNENEEAENEERMISDEVKLSVLPFSCPPKGLVNLGNTCFFNSVVQNLCQTPGALYMMQKALKEDKLDIEDENVPSITCNLPTLCKLSQSFLNFLITMSDNGATINNYTGKQKPRARSESPKALFNQICSVTPRFRTYQQQDSQELFHALLDGIKNEEIKRRKQAILTELGLLRKKTTDIDEKLKEKVKAYGHIASKMPTVIDTLFGGEIVSSVLCDECEQVTQVIEEFLDLSLPIVEVAPLHSNPHNVAGKKSTKKAVENEDAAQPENTPTQSKHSKKKQRRQERKNNKKGRGNAQNTPDPDIENEKDLGQEKDYKMEESSLGLGENGEGDSPSVIVNGNIQSECNMGEKSNGDPNPNLANGDNMDKSLRSLDPNSIQQEQTDVGESSNLETTCNGVPNANGLDEHDEDGHRDSGEVDKSVTDSVDELAEQLDKMSLLPNGGDTANSYIQTDGVDANIKDTAARIAQAALDNGTREYIYLMCANNGDADVEGDQLLGGKSPGMDTVLASDKSGYNSEGDTSPFSGNDEKFGDDTLKSLKEIDGVSLFDTPIKKPEVKTTRFCPKLPVTLSQRYEPEKQECSIQSCLHKFTMAEMLTGKNQYGCDECTKRQNKGNEKSKTVYCNASKQMLIKKPPLILTLQLKRFQQTGRSLRKFSKRVDIPVEFDLSPFCTDDNVADKDGQVLYRLYGIVEHSGSMSRGHYTAYVSVRPQNSSLLRHLGDNVEENTEAEDCESGTSSQWYHVSDTAVSKCTLERALSCNAYLIFYERIFR